MIEPRFAFSTETRDKKENQDVGTAERLLMADGAFAYLACVADGVSQCESPREVAGLALSALRRAVESATLSQLTDSTAREQWLALWSQNLTSEVKRRVRDGFSTLCALLLFAIPDGDELEPREWGLISINVGDSSAFLVSPSVEGCQSLRPEERGGRNSAAGGGIIRAVGMQLSPLFDISYRTFPSDFIGWFWVGSDGVFNFVMGSDLRQFCLNGEEPFRKLPNAVLDLSLSAGRASRRAKLDNATVALLGLNVPEGPTPTKTMPPQPNRETKPRKPNRLLIFILTILAVLILTIVGLVIYYFVSGSNASTKIDDNTVDTISMEDKTEGPNVIPSEKKPTALPFNQSQSSTNSPSGADNSNSSLQTPTAATLPIGQ